MKPLTLLAKFLAAAALAGVTRLAPSRASGDPPAAPAGWFKAGAQKELYDVGVDREVKHAGEAAAYVKPNVAEPGSDSFGTLMQTFRAGTYRGERVRMSAYVRAEDVEGWAGLWMRVDGASTTSLAFDNMQNRPIKGTADWARHEVVLDVPENSAAIAFGILLAGKGRVWVDDFAFERVGKDVPATDLGLADRIPEGPRNLDFGEEL